MQTEEFVPDSIVQNTINKFLTRAKFGKQKYGTDLDRLDFTTDEWANHFLEEHMDAILYVQRWQQDYRKEKKLLDLLIRWLTEDNLNDEEIYEVNELIDWYANKNQLNK